MIKVAVAGCAGRMGSTVINTVTCAEDMEVACGIDPSTHGQAMYADADFPVFATVEEALAHSSFDVMVDFTRRNVVADNVACALAAGIDCVVGTTGLSEETLKELDNFSFRKIRCTRLGKLHHKYRSRCEVWSVEKAGMLRGTCSKFL